METNPSHQAQYDHCGNDPVLDILKDVKRRVDRIGQSFDDLFDAEREAKRTHGKKPSTLISWRHYSAIGAGEACRARDRFLRAPDADPERINQEYRDALERLRAAKKAERDWYRRAGLYDQKLSFAKSRRDERRAIAKLARTRPTSSAGAAAFVRFVADEISIGDADWHMVALATIAEGLEARAA